MARKILEDKKIDRYKLDECCEEQPSLYHYWAKKFADAKEERDFAKTRLENVISKTSLSIRAGNYKIPMGDDGKPIKLSEGTITALINLDSDVQNAQEELTHREKDLLIAKANEETMQQRRSALNNLIELYTKEYYAPTHEGKAPNYSKEDMGSDEQRSKLNKNKKEA